ncbi:hypothetical protein D3C81_1278680 [compost metagenome]
MELNKLHIPNKSASPVSNCYPIPGGYLRVRRVTIKLTSSSAAQNRCIRMQEETLTVRALEQRTQAFILLRD